ncbi:zinc-dependent metalloprotease [uncultured Dokdonia sp.]|uniref:zinc-dependent metalloprotease n=1 Tax=uncultured Dokdonia sp. TaxID=575653 RepID=UPI0026329EFE|nr:zinc-dependent metalloprotease [uncultured Dokdonia sp.]
MKNLILLLLMLSWPILAQDSNCLIGSSSQTRAALITPGELHTPTGNFDTNGDYCIAVRAHRVTTTNQSAPGVPDAVIEDRMESLGAFFGDIDFVWDGVINVANSTALYNADVSGLPCPSFNFGLTDPFDSSGAIDLFFYDKNLGGGNSAVSAADGIANQTRIILSVNNNDIKAISHEIGHVLGLFHTYHGTFGAGTNSNCENSDGYMGSINGTHRDIVECADGSNSIASGDFVADTLPDYFNDTFVGNCTIGVEPIQDVCGSGLDYPAGDPTNIMRPTHFAAMTPECFNHFTTGQKNRMKYFITSQSHLNNLLVDCPIPPDPCLNCNGATFVSQAIENSETELACGQYSLTGPFISNICDEVRVYWDTSLGDDDFVILHDDDTIYNTYDENGSYEVRIEVWRAGQECATATRTFTIDVDCINECMDCTTAGNELIGNIFPAFGCGSYRLQVPSEILDCYTVIFNRGISATDNVTITEANLISGNYFFNYNSNGSYSANITLFDGSTSKCYFNKKSLNIKCLGIIQDEKTSAYPNPFSNQFTIENSSEIGIEKVEVYNATGVLIESIPYKLGEQISINRGSQGVYFAKVYLEDGSIETIQLIKK